MLFYFLSPFKLKVKAYNSALEVGGGSPSGFFFLLGFFLPLPDASRCDVALQ